MLLLMLIFSVSCFDFLYLKKNFVCEERVGICFMKSKFSLVSIVLSVYTLLIVALPLVLFYFADIPMNSGGKPSFEPMSGMIVVGGIKVSLIVLIKPMLTLIFCLLGFKFKNKYRVTAMWLMILSFGISFFYINILELFMNF